MTELGLHVGVPGFTRVYEGVLGFTWVCRGSRGFVGVHEGVLGGGRVQALALVSFPAPPPALNNLTTLYHMAIEMAEVPRVELEDLKVGCWQ